MDAYAFASDPSYDRRGGRLHRFMESSDINAAFRELFGPLRRNVRQGMTIDGQVYALEMDSCIPGQLLGTDWLPTAACGVASPAELADPAPRRALFDRLLAERRPESLFAYVCERRGAPGPALIYVELVSADGTYAAEFPLWPGRGWRKRDLMKARHRRIDAVARA